MKGRLRVETTLGQRTAIGQNWTFQFTKNLHLLRSMKPPICSLCNRDFRSEHFHYKSGGDLVQFADYEPLAQGIAGHPRGLAWFCRDHLEQARAYAFMPCAVALSTLVDQFGVFPAYKPSPCQEPSLWITAIGPNPARVFAIIRQATSMAPAETKHLMSLGQLKVSQGWPSQFISWQRALIDAGATVEVRF